MLDAEDVDRLETMVVLIGLAIGLVLGWIARHARFCTVGAISDCYASGDTARLRMWGLAVITAIAATQLLISFKLIQAGDSFYTAPRLLWLSNIAGGLTFGFGMALASGCGSRTLVRIGEGSLKALVVFLVMAVTAYMTMRGILAVLRVGTIERVGVDLGTRQDLASILGMPPAIVAAVIVIGGGALVLGNRNFLQQPRLLIGGLLIGILVAAGWATTGGIGFIEEDPNTLEARFLSTSTRGIESLTFVAPLAYSLELLMLWSDTSRVVTFSIATVGGVVVGACIHAVASGGFRLEGFHDRTDLIRHLSGAAMMGAGGVTGFGCTIGQGITGLSLLALGSVLTTLSIIGGAWLGLRWIERRE
jgi:uncharacterized membrane protein YedE/YeeE